MIRLPIVFTAVLLACFAGHNQWRIATLRGERERLAAEVAERELPNKHTRNNGDRGPDRMADVQLVAEELTNHVRETNALGSGVPDEETRRRMIARMDRLMSLNGAQLKALIKELRVGWTPEDNERERLIAFAIGRLTSDYPQDALDIITGSDEMRDLARRKTNSLSRNWIFKAVQSWADADQVAAERWVRGFEGDGYLAGQMTSAKAALIFSAAKRDPNQALSLIAKLGLDQKNTADTLARGVTSSAQRLDLLAVLRLGRTRESDEGSRRDVFDRNIRFLLMGMSRDRPGFDFATRWIDGSGLSMEEIAPIIHDLPRSVEPEETGRWVEWLWRKLPADDARKRAGELFGYWARRDSQAAGEWLVTAVDGPAKQHAARVYAEMVFPHDRETAIRWIETLSPDLGGERE